MPGSRWLETLKGRDKFQTKVMALSIDQLKRICPLARLSDLERILDPLNATMREFGMSGSTLRVAAFIAQTAHETAGFRYLEEIWGPTDAQKRYDPPFDLAERLGNIENGDGFRYRGRGLIQVTGRANYRTIGDQMRLDLLAKPDLLALPSNAARSAGLFWQTKGLNTLADQADFDTITKRINGGLNGIQDRRAYYARVIQVIAR
jgi:predicted chitinase